MKRELNARIIDMKRKAKIGRPGKTEFRIPAKATRRQIATGFVYEVTGLVIHISSIGG